MEVFSATACFTCKKAFVETKGTMFYRLRHEREEVAECMAMVGDRASLAAIHRIKGIKEETVCNWLDRAASHVEQFEEGILKKYKLSRIQLDASQGKRPGIKEKKGEI